MTRVGRPKAKLAVDVPSLTRQVRKLLDQVHGGNLAAAQRATGIPYPTLRDLYAGRTANPELATLEQLRAAYGVSLNWFTEAGAQGEVPLSGRRVLLPPNPRDPRGGRALREVEVPYAARTLFDVFALMERWLQHQAAVPERPVVGEATGDTFAFRLTSFLLQPLLAAEKLGEDVVPAAPPAAAPAVEAAWVEKLEALGQMWRALLPGIAGRP